jgi:hypothetical protein
VLAQMLLVLIPTVAYPFDSGTLRRADVQNCAARVLELSGYGRREFERAAFLVLRDDGDFVCDVWPASFRWRSERWTGKIPSGTAAVMHTHPRSEGRPSVNDMAQARRLDVPVIVVTAEGLSMAQPDGRILAVSSRIATAPGALSPADEATRDRQAHTRQAGAVSH